MKTKQVQGKKENILGNKKIRKKTGKYNYGKEEKIF
jgi:hypothetical protein